jgi:hypothetical protein
MYREARNTQENLCKESKNACHASLISSGAGTLPRFDFTAPASIRSATQPPFIAGPLAVIKNFL